LFCEDSRFLAFIILLVTSRGPQLLRINRRMGWTSKPPRGENRPGLFESREGRLGVAKLVEHATKLLPAHFKPQLKSAYRVQQQRHVRTCQNTCQFKKTTVLLASPLAMRLFELVRVLVLILVASVRASWALPNSPCCLFQKRPRKPGGPRRLRSQR